MTTVGLQPTTVREAAELMAPVLGLKWPEHRKEILDYINDYRDILYNSYSDLKLFDNVFHCIEVSSFPNDCRYPCYGRPCHQGIVLPSDVVSVAAAYEYGQPLILRSRWRESQLGIDSTVRPRIELVETAEQMPTERAMTCETALKVFADSSEDAGKVVSMEVVTADTGESKTFRFELRDDGWAIVNVPVRSIISVSLPSGCRSNITLAQADGYVLSVYGPYETVPSYRKFRIAHACRSGRVLIQGVKGFRPVCFDDDVVEVGSRTVLKAAASFLKFRSGSTDSKDINRAEYDRTEMGRMLRGLHERHRGNAEMDGPSFYGAVNTATILPGYHR